MAAATTIEIEHRGASGWLLHDGTGRAWIVEPDGKERAVSGPDGGETYLRASWEDSGALTVRRVRAGWPTVTERYSLIEGGATLEVRATRSGGPRGEFTSQRIYQRENEASESAEDAGSQGGPERLAGSREMSKP